MKSDIVDHGWKEMGRSSIVWNQVRIKESNTAVICEESSKTLKTLSSATSPGQSGPGSDDNEGVLCIPQSSSITGTSLSDCLVSYPRHLLGRGGGVLPLCRDVVCVFYSLSCWAIDKQRGKY